MSVVSSRTFKSGNNEAVRLPKEVAFGGEIDVTIVRSGDVLTVYPTRMSVPEMVRRLGELPGPDTIEARDVEEPPERL